jgi:hypothetical protein
VQRDLQHEQDRQHGRDERSRAREEAATIEGQVDDAGARDDRRRVAGLEPPRRAHDA